MSSIQKTLESLQPYVIGIRYLDGLPVVDAVFKEGWTLPESDIIKKVKGNEELNYYMIFSEKDGIGLDELLDFVDIVIKANIEREKKHELLKEKVNELKDLFKKTSLTKLKRLKFDFLEEDLISSIDDFDLEEKIEVTKVVEETTIELIENPILKADESEYSDEDAEILEEERRAKNFKKIQETKKSNSHLNNIKNKVELPPKKNYETDVDVMTEECGCGPNEACGKCIENKDL
jgi:hypothetical protein